MDKKEKNQEQWNDIKKPILKNVRTGITNRENTLKNIEATQKNLGKSTDIIKEELRRLYFLEKIYDNNKVNPPLNEVVNGQIGTMTTYSYNDVYYSEQLNAESQFLKTNAEYLLGTLTASGLVTTSNMTSITSYLIDGVENNGDINEYIKQIENPSARDRRIELQKKLKEINTRFSQKLEGAWQTLQDESKTDRFLQAASSARELISDVLCYLAPDEEVKKMNWFEKQRENGLPTQKQRARYAMLGTNNSLKTDQLLTIYQAMDNIRDSYNRLSPIAHLRDYDTNIQAQTENLIDQCQIYLLKILNNRELYYKN